MSGRCVNNQDTSHLCLLSWNLTFHMKIVRSYNWRSTFIGEQMKPSEYYFPLHLYFRDQLQLIHSVMCVNQNLQAETNKCFTKSTILIINILRRCNRKGFPNTIKQNENYSWPGIFPITNLRSIVCVQILLVIWMNPNENVIQTYSNNIFAMDHKWITYKYLQWASCTRKFIAWSSVVHLVPCKRDHSFIWPRPPLKEPYKGLDLLKLNMSLIWQTLCVSASWTTFLYSAVWRPP